MNSNFLFQDLRFGKGGCNASECKELKVSVNENWNKSDVVLLKSIPQGELTSLQTKFLLSKRCLKITNDEGVDSIIVVPHGEVSFSRRLGELAEIYYKIQTLEDKEAKKKGFENFYTKLYVLRLEIAKRLFSKRFSRKYLFHFEGISGVALTHSRGIDEILVPEWSGLKIGDYAMVTRDPIQNIVVVCKVVGFTPNQIRVSPEMLDRYLAGDCDGDKIQIISLEDIYNMNSQYFRRTYEEFYAECMKLIPGDNFGYTDMLNENI